MKSRPLYPRGLPRYLHRDDENRLFMVLHGKTYERYKDDEKWSLIDNEDITRVLTAVHFKIIPEKEAAQIIPNLSLTS